MSDDGIADRGLTGKDWKAMLLAGCLFVIVCVIILLYLLAIWPRTSHMDEVMRYNGVLFAHRGFHNKDKYIPENSMAAFRAAVEHGYGIELDIHITKDGRLAVFHDDTMERMCGVSANVEKYTFAELQKYHLLNTTERIPELTEVLSYVDGRVPLLIELKIPEQDLAVCEASYQLLKAYKGRYMVQSFNTMGLYWYRMHAPEVLRGQLSSDLTRGKEETPYILRFLVRYLLSNIIGKPDFISYKLKDLPNISVSLCRRLFGTPVAVWTLRTDQALREGKAHYNMCIFEKKGRA